MGPSAGCKHGKPAWTNGMNGVKAMAHMDLSFGDPQRLQKVARALSSEVRLSILQLLD